MQAEVLDGAAEYVITGGTGGLGLLFAAWMEQGGARHVTLLGRSGRGANPAEMAHLLRGSSQVRRPPSTGAPWNRALHHCMFAMANTCVAARTRTFQEKTMFWYEWVQVTITRADPALAGEAAEAQAAIWRRGHRLAGVIHAAGTQVGHAPPAALTHSSPNAHCPCAA